MKTDSADSASSVYVGQTFLSPAILTCIWLHFAIFEAKVHDLEHFLNLLKCFFTN